MPATDAQIKAFIRTLAPLAINECNRRIASGGGFILPSICIAQSALETGWGTAGLMTKANAFFGIKAGGSWTGKIYVADTWEVAPNGESYNTVANFRAYDNLEDSVRDYYDLLLKAPRYAKAISYGTDRSKWLSARETITAIWAAGYATDNLYVSKIMNHVEPRNLTTYDALVTGVYNGPTVSYSPVSWSSSDLVSGVLAVTDSGRSIGLTANSKALSLNWEKALETPIDVSYTVSIKDGYVAGTLYGVQLVGDVATVSETPITNGSTLVIPAGAKWAFNLIPKDLSMSGTISPEDVGGFVLELTPSGLPDGSASYAEALASFVKIE